MKNKSFIKKLLVLLVVLITCIPQMWAGDMYIKGERNSWDYEKMTEEVSGSKWTFIAYWQNGTDHDAFKITSKTDWSGLNLGGNGSNVNLSWGTKSGALYNNGGSKDIILPSLPTGGAVVKITVTYESSNYYVKAEKLSEEGNSWVDINAPKIYWDNTNAAYTNVSMLNGRVWAGYDQALGSVASALTHISNTNLWYNTSINNVGNAGKYTTTLFVNANWSSWETNVATKRAPYATSFTASNTTSLNSNTYLFSAANGNKGATLSRSQLSSGYSELNKTQTIEVYVKMAGGSYTKKTSSWPGTLTPDRYYLSDATTATHVNNVALTASSSVTTSAVLTSAFSLSESSTTTGYNFDGWGTSSSSTPSGKNSPYSISSIAGTNTICAFFSEKTYTVTVNNDGNGTTDPSGAQSNVGQLTGIAIEAEEAEGYEFTNWTIVSGTGTFTGGGTTSTSASTTFYPTSAATIRANFSSTATSTLTVTATAGGSITTPAAGYYSDISEDEYDIEASRTEGYKFTGWTKTAGDGVVTFGDASSLSTTATITTLGDVTVTAGFAAMSNSLSVSSSTLYAGDNITLTATRTNHSLNLTYQYKIGDGSWTDIATQSGTSKTWQIPYANTYQTYKFRVKSTDGSTSFYSAEQTVNVKGRITIHVKNTNSWATMKLYSWYNDGSDHATNGDWNGTTGTGSNGQSCSIHATGSQWWDVTITQTTSTAQKFILSCSTSGNQNKTADLNLSSFTHDAYYAMSTNGSAVQTLSTTTTPSAPTVSTLTAGTIRETSAILGGNIANAAALGNDIITERGYYWSTDKTLSPSNLGVGTKVTVSGTQSAAGNFSSTKSSLTAGTKYYFLAYAKNGYGTGYSSVQNFTTLSTYTVTVTAGDGGSASPSSVTAGQYLASGTITASANTGYTFYNWTKTSGDGTVTFTNANAASTTLKSTNTATVRANFVDMWNVKGSWDSWAAYEPMTATGVSNTYSATKTLAAKTAYHIKVVKRVDNNSSNDKWYGVNGGTTLSRATGSVTGLEENGGETEYITFTTDAAGDYTITYLYNASVGSMKVTVGYPTAYTMTFAARTFKIGASGETSTTGGTLTAKDQVNTTLVTGNKVKAGGSAIFTATKNTGYTFNGFFSNEACTTGYSAGAGVALSGDGNTILTLSSLSADKEVYAKFSENVTTVNLVASPTGKGTFTKGGAAVTSVSAGVTTKPTVTAVPGTGYRLTGTIWSKDNSNITLNTTTSSPVTVTGCGTASTSSTLTATFTPITYTIRFNGRGNTSGSMTNQTSIAYDASTNITTNAFVKTGYNFAGWATTAERAAAGTVDRADGAAHGNLSSTHGATVDLFAVWTPKQSALTLDKQTSATGYGSAGTVSTSPGSATYDAAMPTLSGTMPTAANGYAFMGFYDATEGGGTKYYNADGSSAHNWDKNTESGTTLYAYYKKAEITALVADPGVIAPDETITITPTISPTPTGTTKVCYELQYSNGTPLPSQPEMEYDGTSVSFTVPHASATYKIEAKLYTGSTCGSGTLLSTNSTTFQVAGEHTVTVRYQDGSGRTLAASTEITGKPLEWTTAGDITPPTITGYTFARWDAGDGVTIKNGESDPVTTTTTSSIQIKAVYDGTLTAVYNKKNMIFFNNTLGWEDVWVYFYNSDKYWSDGYGTGAYKGQYFDNCCRPYWEMERGHMTQIEGTNIWYFDYTAAGYSTRPNVAFTNMGDQSGVNPSGDDWSAPDNDQAYFSNTTADPIQVIRRSDHKSSLPMFVPLTGQTKVKKNDNKAEYLSDGYWMNYPENTGYTLKIYNAWNANRETAAVQSIAFPYSEDKTMPLKMDVELSDGYNHEYWFMVYRNDGTYWGNEYHFKQGYNAEQIITNVDKKSKITTSAPGNYTFTLTYHDNGSGTVNYYIDVDFPIATGDYRIYYSDNATWSKAAHTKDSWCHPSHSIGKATTEAKKDTISFFIPKGEGISHTMKFQKASVTNDGVVSWSDVDGGSITIPSSVTTTGVYNFIVSQPAGGASISLEKAEPYTGNYYIRTDCAGNTKWDSFKNLDHQMTYSDYAENNSGFSHYYAHWVESGVNVKFVIANDYSMCITDTLIEDYGTTIANISNIGALNSGDASIRFMWNQSTNKISRAYISGSSNISDRFLVLEGDAKMYDKDGNALSITGLNANEINLVDDQNFVYKQTIQVNTTARAKLTAKYNNNVQYFKGSSGAFAEGTTIQLLGGEASDTKHTMRIVYDFKTNRLVTAYVPSGTIEDDLEINADLMIVREHQEAGQQLLFNGGSLSEVHTVYGVMRFNRWTLNNKSTAAGHAPLGDPKSPYERGLYWISFPFDVNLSDVFGFGTYGTHWIIMEYDGVGRAANGYWIDSPSFWRYVTDRSNKVLEAGKGYVLALDLDLMKSDNTSFWTNNIEQVELFFPSAAEVKNIEATDVQTSVEEHECTIDRTNNNGPDINKNRTRADSHWNIIGIPSYANYGTSLTSDGSTTITWRDDPNVAALPYLYEWNSVDNTYSVQSGTTYPFKAMHAYMVQYHGDLYWSLASATPPSSIVARRTYAEKPQSTEFRLELQQNDKKVDQTFVKLSNDENVSANFVFDEDLCKEYNANKANIYTFIEGYIPAAGNTLPMSDQTTVVPVGVKIVADGDYTFSMPDGTEGIGITLIDNETGIRTSLSALDYTINLTAGTYENRFMLEISPIQQTPTDIEEVTGYGLPVTGARKVMIDGILYIVKDGKMFDARGAMVK